MKTQNEIRISIPKPCHEDWNKMTPNEKGAFCGKCAKTVIDFTTKTGTEIQDFFSEQQDSKICGRFKNDQLEPPKKIDLFIPLHHLPQKLTFNKAFIISLFIVFGTSLFSCSTQTGEVVGKIAPVDTIIEIKTGEVMQNPLTGDTIIDHSNELKNIQEKNNEELWQMKGDVSIERTVDPISADSSKNK